MCVDYTSFNKACPKDLFPLPQIDQVVDSTLGYEILSLLGSNSVVTRILGCNMAILDAIWINCIYVSSLICGCIWNVAIGFCILVDVVLQYGGFAMHI